MNAVPRAVLASAAVIVLAFGLAGCTANEGFVVVRGRTLLTHPSTGVSADALGAGVLGTNISGCVTMGDLVLVVPNGSALSSDGSITVEGKRHRSGSSIQLGGGAGARPPGAKCGKSAKYFWVG
jgi:hypothetical protein